MSDMERAEETCRELRAGDTLDIGGSEAIHAVLGELERLRGETERLQFHVDAGTQSLARMSDQLGDHMRERDDALKENVQLRENAAEVFVREMHFEGGSFEMLMKTGPGAVYCAWVRELMKSQGAENFVTTTLRFNDGADAYYITAGRARGKSVDEKYAEARGELDEARAENGRLKADAVKRDLSGCPDWFTSAMRTLRNFEEFAHEKEPAGRADKTAIEIAREHGLPIECPNCRGTVGFSRKVVCGCVDGEGFSWGEAAAMWVKEVGCVIAPSRTADSAYVPVAICPDCGHALANGRCEACGVRTENEVPPCPECKMAPTVSGK